MTLLVNSLSLDDARRLIAAGEARATEIGVPSCIAVVDAGGNLIAFVRQDGAWIGSVDIAIGKAFTARAFDMTTAELGKMATAGQPLEGIQAGNGGRIVIFGGGAPVKLGGQVVGAVGASGGTVEQDMQVAGAALAAFGDGGD